MTHPDSLQVLLILPSAGKCEWYILLTGKLAKLRRRLQILMMKKNIFALFFCDAPSWVCLLYAQVWYGGVPGAPDMEPEFVFALCYAGCSLIVVLIGGGAAWMFFLGLSFKSHRRLPIPKQNRGWLLYFYHSCFNFFSMHLTAGTCLNSRLLAMWQLKRKAGPFRKVKMYGCICRLMIIMWGMVNSSAKK